MGLFVVRYDYREGSDAVRDEHRPAHRAYLGQQAGLRLSGPTSDRGGVLIFDAATAAEVEALLNEDPFWTLDTIQSRTISGWTPVSGSWLEPLGL